jgi:hypothetical protein
MELQKLEGFRNNDYGETAFILATTPPMSVSFNYDTLSAHAYRFTSRCLQELENSGSSLDNGYDCLPAITMWYGSLDSFLNSVLQLFCLKNGENFEVLSLYTLNNKYEYLLSAMSLSLSDNEKLMSDKLEDLVRLEKWVRRDFVNGASATFKTANFSNRPMALNQVDILQCMLIAIEIFQNFRFVIAGLDLMPNIPMKVSEQTFYDKLDMLFRSVMLPSFKDILSKQRLTVELDLKADFSNIPVSSVFLEKEILIACKVIEDNQYKRLFEGIQTNIQGGFFNQFVKKIEGQEDHFRRNYLAPGFDPFSKAKD